MTEESSVPAHPNLTVEELTQLLRDGDPPLTRRELRQRDRAEQAGLLTRVDGRLVIASEPPVVTSADVLEGKVPAASGLTRRQLRELAAQQEPQEQQAQEQEEPEGAKDQHGIAVQEESLPSPAPAPNRVSAKNAVARRPVIRPDGAETGEYTGEFDQIRAAMADINAAPDTPPVPPQRRSVFEAAIPAELTEPTAQDPEPAEATNAADWSTVTEQPVVTDDVMPDAAPVSEPAAEPAPAAEPEPAPEPEAEDEDVALPDWHTLTAMPTIRPGESGANLPAVVREAAAKGTPVWLTVLQWAVIVVVAIVLGLLVWYGINRGFGTEGPDAMGIIAPQMYLTT